MITSDPKRTTSASAGSVILSVTAVGAVETLSRRDLVKPLFEDQGVRVYRRAVDVDPEIWQAAFGDSHKDFEYFRLIEDTLTSDFAFRYMVLVNEAEQAIALQPLILVDQDLATSARSTIARLIGLIRRFWPRFLRTRMLMAGCVVGESKLGVVSPVDRQRASAMLAEALIRFARSQRICLVAVKDFSAKLRKAFAPLVNAAYTRLAGFPSLILDLNFGSFDEYLRTHLSRITRKGLRRKLRKADKAAPPIQVEVLEDCSDVIDEIYPLYLAVAERSDVEFEVFTREYFLEAGRRMPGRFRYFIWRRAGKAVAFSFCAIWKDTLYDNDIGLDYDIAHDLNLYYLTFRDLIQWALKHDLKYYCSAPFNYDPKLRLRLNPVDVDLYVRHTSWLLNSLIKMVAPYFAPAKSDPALRKHLSRAKKGGCDTALFNGSVIPGCKLPSAQSLSPSQNFS